MEEAGARLAEVLTALSVATDLGIGRPPESAMRACILASCLAEQLGVDGDEAANAYYTTLLRYIGCTSYAHEEGALADGDEVRARAVVTRLDLANLDEVASGLQQLMPGLALPREAVQAIASLPGDFVSSHCEVSIALANRLGMAPGVQHALGQLFERWDGLGLPRGLSRKDLSLSIRIATVATQAVAFLPDGHATVEAVMKQRSGGWFDPEIVETFLRHGRSMLADVETADVWRAAVEAEPDPHKQMTDASPDEVAAAFADFTDLKTRYLLGHSRGVAALVEKAAVQMGMPDGDVATLRRAALFHDLGRVAVPVGIWEKTGPLSEIEWEAVRLHPYHTERILSRAPALKPLAALAGMHHERLDGSGYFRSATAPTLTMAMRLLGAADAYQAMTEARPYRPALAPEAAAANLSAEVKGGRLDTDAVRAVLVAAGHVAGRKRAGRPAGLSAREVEVLRLIGTGASYAEVASTLVISPRTAAHHVQHIYDKIGASTRAAAALFAMQHQLL
jgi:HD-GYP domain-containing protein (c-di-GMP phosphodiesterase class II)